MEKLKYHYTIKTINESFDFDIGYKQGIYIQFHQETDYYIYITIHDAKDKYIGEVHYGFNHFPKSIFLSDYISSINASIIDVGTEKLTFKIYSFSDRFLPYDINLEIQYFEFLKVKNCSENIIELSERLGSKENPLLLYKAQDDCYHPTLSQRIYEKGWKYYRGDFHGHSNYSDGNIEFTDIASYIKEQKMDFMAMTEHNAVPFVLPNSEQLFIPSFELTLPGGHINIHGMHQLLIMDEPTVQLLFDSNNHEIYPINTLLNHYKGIANISINHMFMEPWDFQMLDLNLLNINTIEVICDPTYPTASKANDIAIAFMDFLWNKGIHLYGIGGSDCHQTMNERYEGATKPSVYGDPGTYVYSRDLSVQGIIDSVKKGMSYVSRFCDLDIIINQGSVLPGQVVKGRKLDYNITIRPFLDVDTEGWEGYIIMNGIIVKKFNLSLNYLCKWQFELDCSAYDWVRFGIVDKNRHEICYVNPIYFGKVDVANYRLKELLEEFKH